MLLLSTIKIINDFSNPSSSLVPLDKQSQNIWSPWTNGPQDNWSPRTIGPQNLLVVSKSIMEPFFQFFDIGWSTLDIMDDFKPISKKNLFAFRQIITFCFCSKTFFSLSFWIRNGIFKQKII